MKLKLNDQDIIRSYDINIQQIVQAKSANKLAILLDPDKIVWDTLDV
jgi:hypothetical protein